MFENMRDCMPSLRILYATTSFSQCVVVSSERGVNQENA